MNRLDFVISLTIYINTKIIIINIYLYTDDGQNPIY